MRPFIFLIVGFLILAVIFTVIIFVPQNQSQSIRITKIDLNRQPQPVVPSDPGGGYILDFFPDPADAAEDTSITDALIDAPPQQGLSDSETAQVQQNPIEVQQEIDKNYLLSLIHDWAYTDYIEVGIAKQGTIFKQRENVSFSVYEDTVLENGIKIIALNADAALLEWGESTFNLRRAQQPIFYEQVKQTMRPLTREEQAQAFDYYMRVYGDKFKEMSKNYKPLHGVQMPKQVTAEDQKKGLQEYWQQYGKQFSKENAAYQPQFYYNDQKQKEAYNKYWQQFGNGQSQPNFDEVFNNDTTGIPGSRIVPAEMLEQN